MKTLLVASTGGHLSELQALADRLAPAPQRSWVTFDTEQARSSLTAERLLLVPDVPPRDARAALAALPAALGHVRRERAERVVSTGAAIALPYLLAARLLRREAHYVESAARTAGPSLTGQLVSRVPGVQLHQQEGEQDWGVRWRRSGSVFDGFVVTTRSRTVTPPMRVLVLLGTMPFPFPRLVEQVLSAVEPLPSVELTWQAGSTHVPAGSGRVSQMLSAAALQEQVDAADVVVSHAGVGSSLLALSRGRRPVLLPRTAALGEHVDDHQMALCRTLGRRELALTPATITSNDLVRAASSYVERASVADRAYLPTAAGR